MQEVKIIYVDTVTGLEPDNNFLVYDTVEGKWYIGNGTAIPQQISTSESPVYSNQFMLMGA